MIKEAESKIQGAFAGWNPATIYQLKNGTKWMLSFSKNSVKSLNTPDVTVWRDGTDYYLEVHNAGEMQRVRRVE